jgi:hypothetical protein
MEMTVPTRNMPRNAVPAARDGRVSASRTIMSASGCRPWTIPVANVAKLTSFLPAPHVIRCLFYIIIV